MNFSRIMACLMVVILVFPNLGWSKKRQILNPAVSAYITKGTRLTVCGALLLGGLNALVPSADVSSTATGYGLPKIVTDKVDFLNGKLPSLSQDSSLKNMSLQSLVIFAGQVSYDVGALIENVPSVAHRVFRLTADELILLTGTSAELVGDLIKDLNLDKDDRLNVKDIQLQSSGIGLIELTRSDAAARARAFNEKWGTNLTSAEWYKKSGYELVNDSVDAALNPVRAGRAIYLAYELPASDPRKQKAFETSFQSMTRYLEISLGLTLVAGLSRRSPIGRYGGISQGICLAQNYWTYPCVTAANKLVYGIRSLWGLRSKLKEIFKSDNATNPRAATESAPAPASAPASEPAPEPAPTSTKSHVDINPSIVRSSIVEEAHAIYTRLYYESQEAARAIRHRGFLLTNFHHTHFSIMMEKLDFAAIEQDQLGQFELAQQIRTLRDRARGDWNRQVEGINDSLINDPSFGRPF